MDSGAYLRSLGDVSQRGKEPIRPSLSREDSLLKVLKQSPLKIIEVCISEPLKNPLIFQPHVPLLY